MNPISILSSVSAASRVTLALSTTLFTFVQATRDVNHSVRALYDEVTSLIGTLDAISSSIKTTDTGKGKQPEQNPELWRSVITSLDHCRGSVDNMYKTLQGVQKPSSNIAGQALRAFKLNWKDDQIRTLRSQIQTHNTALQLALQMINVYLNTRAPGLVIDDLVPRIEILTDMIIQLSKIPDSSNQRDRQSHLHASDSKESSDVASLMASAHELLNKAQSVVAQSEGGSDQGSYLDLLEQELQDSLTITQGYQPDKPSGAAFDRQRVVENWIPAVSSATITSHFDSSSITTHTQMTPTQSTCETPSLGGVNLESLEGDDSDNDDDLEFEILQGFLDRGSSVYKSGDWASAQKFFERALESSTLLPSDKIHQRSIDLQEAQFKIAICAFHQNVLEEAEAKLLQFRTAPTSINEPRDISLRRIISTYLFAEVCFQKKNLDGAHKQCRRAHSMKRKLIGKEFSWLEANSFNLLKEIANAKGDALAAEVYQAKELEYTTTLSSGTEPNQVDPAYRMVELDIILRSRASQEKAESVTEEPRSFTDRSEFNAFLKITPFVVAYCCRANTAHEASFEEFKQLSSEFRPGSFIYWDIPFSGPPQFFIQLPSQEAFRNKTGAKWPEEGGDSIESKMSELRMALKDKRYDEYRVRRTA